MKSNVIDLREPIKPLETEPHPYGGEKVPPIKRRKEPESKPFPQELKNTILVNSVLNTTDWRA